MTNVIRIIKGLDLPIEGAPKQEAEDARPPRTVALVGDDYVGMRPTMAVAVGDRVRLGQPLFTDKKTPGVQFTSPGCGTVSAIHRGEKRRFLSLVVELDGEEAVEFEAFSDFNLTQLDGTAVRRQLVASGLWTALRTRPYSRIPAPDTVPHSIFITAIDTQPLAADPATVLASRAADFIAGVETLSTLTDGPLYLCKKAAARIPGEDLSCAEVVAFDGPHPAGLPGTHIHFLDPVHLGKTVWHIGYQDVVSIGRLFLTGQLSTERIIALSGPLAKNPRLVRTRQGASIADLIEGEVSGDDNGVRVISGSVLSGRACVPPTDYLGRYDVQISLLAEGRQREFLGWLAPGNDRFSLVRAFTSGWGNSDRRFSMTTNTGGSRRAIVPIGTYEKVMPLDVVATALLKALVTDDTEYAQALGCLELDEEDLSLCTFVCPAKYDYGPILRRNLTRIAEEG